MPNNHLIRTKVFHLYLPGVLLALLFSQCKPQTSASEYYMLVGTYTNTDSKGIYIYSFDSETGGITEVATQDGIKNPSYLTIHGDHVYAVSETGGDETGSISSYNFDRKAGKLHFLNNVSTEGDDPCYVETDKTGKFVAVANYSGGSLILYKTGEDGSLLDNPQLIRHENGSGVNPGRQKSPHVHETVFSPDQQYLLTPDLGKDMVMIYKFDKEKSEPLSLASQIISDPGSGPRHITFHPELKFAYLIRELDARVAAYKYDDSSFTKIQDLPTWKEGFEGGRDGAELKVSSDGRFLYVSNRGDQNSIAIYSIDQTTGKLALKDIVPVDGKGPRDFEIDPSGNFLLVTNQGTNNIVTFKRDKETGLLTKTGEIQVPVPVCIKFTNK